MDMRYEKPQTVAAACSLLAEDPAGSVVLAGGTDLQVKLRARHLAPRLVVDVKAIPELRAIRVGADGECRIGAAVTMRELYADERIVARYPALARGAEAVGSIQVRARATVGGNLCNASPCMDTAPGLLVMGAKLELATARSTRTVPLDGFFAGVKKTGLAPAELCVAVVIPAAAQRLRTAFAKVKRVNGHDLAVVNAAVAYDPVAKTMVAAIGSCAPTPVLTPPLTGVAAAADASALADKLAALAAEVVRPIDDVRASAEYRRDMTTHLVRSLVRELLAAGRRAA